MSDPKKPVPTGSDDGLVSHTHTETPEEVAAFWSEERVRSAQPLPLPKLKKEGTPGEPESSNSTDD